MATRRTFLLNSALAMAGAHVRFAQASTSPVRETAQGTLRGESAEGVEVFRGVPFAEPPLGGLRFRPPQPPRRWIGVRDATHFADAAAQSGDLHFPQSEDCLYLNIWAPKTAGPHPVFVWIHGGGFVGGRPSEPLYDGTRFAQAGIVCISIAYRLGVFGFLDVSKFFGTAFTGSADHALLDIVAALQWVQANIANFGGDPQKVTIGGESAGAKLTGILMGTPLAQPLFHQMISESGGAERIGSQDQATAVAEGFAATWQSTTSLPVAALQTAPTQQLIAAQTAFMKSWPAHFPLRPELTPNLIPETPLQSMRRGGCRGKRLLIGTNRDESAAFIGPHPDHEVTANELGNEPLARFLPMEAAYRKLYPQFSDAQIRIRAVTAEEYWIPSIRVADAEIAGGGEAYVYRLDFPGTGRFAGLAFHSYDLRFVWDYFGTTPPTPEERSLAASMHAAWVSFIKGETPAGPDLPAWPLYGTNSRPTMIFDHTSRIEMNPSGAELHLWDGQLAN